MTTAKPVFSKPAWPALPWPGATAFLAACLLGAALAMALQPKRHGTEHVDLSAVPSRFGVWREVPSPYVPVGVTNSPDRSEAAAATYDQVLMRTYIDDKGRKVMLALAFIAANRQEAKIHRPELCYTAQGFSISKFTSHDFDVPLGEHKAVHGKRMEVASNGRLEAVSYWIRIGSLYSDNAFETRLYILLSGLKRVIPDGMLVRASQIVQPGANSMEETYRVQEAFLRDLYLASPEPVKRLLAR